MGNGSYAARSSTELGVPLSEPLAGARAHLAAFLAPPTLAAVSAVLISLSLPPADIHFLAWICLVPFFLAIRSCRSPIRSALCSVVFVLLFGSVFAHWLPGTLAVFFGLSPTSAWLSALAVYASFGILPIGLFAVLAHVLLRHRRPLVILAGVPMLWVAAEFFRVHLLGGLPWALLGHALYRQPTLIQIADFAGVFGVSFLLATVNTGMFLALRHTISGRRRLVPLAIAASLVGVAWLYGSVRLSEISAQSLGEKMAVGVLQPNRAPVYRWTQVAADRALLTYLRLSQQHFEGKDLSLVVWPENAVPLYPERDKGLQTRLAHFAETIGAPLVLGAPGSAGNGSEPAVFNAAHFIKPTEGLVATYRKRRLVPFAEYSPVASTAVGDGPSSAFVAGDEAVIFTSGGVRWGPTICLDFVFADVVRASVRAGAEVLVNLSNDSWLVAGGQGAAEQQHAQAVFRAVENRRDVVRATTTGISAALSAGGVPEAVLGEGEMGALIAHVTPRQELTLYTRWGDLFAMACGFLGVGIFVAARATGDGRPEA
jgi:apolipoprotein N-acyltransferase